MRRRSSGNNSEQTRTVSTELRGLPSTAMMIAEDGDASPKRIPQPSINLTDTALCPPGARSSGLAEAEFMPVPGSSSLTFETI